MAHFDDLADTITEIDTLISSIQTGTVWTQKMINFYDGLAEGTTKEELSTAITNYSENGPDGHILVFRGEGDLGTQAEVDTYVADQLSKWTGDKTTAQSTIDNMNLKKTAYQAQIDGDWDITMDAAYGQSPA